MHIISMTAVSYVIALLASLTILWFFGRLDGEPIITVVGQTVAAPMTKLEKNWLEWICLPSVYCWSSAYSATCFTSP
jgi:hypothetical protein